jgi:hypothetical protein
MLSKPRTPSGVTQTEQHPVKRNAESLPDAIIFLRVRSWEPIGRSFVGWCTVEDVMAVEENDLAEVAPRRTWLVGVTGFLFILLQSACTAVMAISGVRVIIGLGALAAAAGLNRPASGFHADAIRIPMMAIAVVGSLINLYVIWRIRSLRSRPAAQWRTVPVSARQKRAENFQIVLAIVTLALVFAEWTTHRIVHNVP